MMVWCVIVYQILKASVLTIQQRGVVLIAALIVHLPRRNEGVASTDTTTTGVLHDTDVNDIRKDSWDSGSTFSTLVIPKYMLIFLAETGQHDDTRGAYQAACWLGSNPYLMPLQQWCQRDDSRDTCQLGVRQKRE